MAISSMNPINPMNSRNLIFVTVLFTLVTTSVCPGQTPVDSLIPKEISEEWALMEGPQVYTKKTLFEHIDGQAELFFKYGFQKSAFAIYQDKKNDKNQIEVDVYHMGSVLQAFGIFSRFRNEDRPGGIGFDSYLDDHSLLFYQGKYFIMLYAVESNPAILKEFGMAVSSKILDPSLPPKEIGYFSKNGLKLGSIQYFPEGLLGHQFLKRGFRGTYLEKDEDKTEAKVEVKGKAEDKEQAKIEDKGFHLFLAIFKNSQEAMSALKAYEDYLSKKGKIYSGISSQFRPHALMGDDPYQGKIIAVPKGFYLAGIVGFENEKNAEKLLKQFLKNIR
jgi:hypothetical protein